MKVSHALIRLGRFIESLPVVTMNPDELIEFGKTYYSKTQEISSWGEDELIETGLSDDENDMLQALPLKTGDLLVLGVGGGREAIPLVRAGFRVTGVDYLADMVNMAKENAIRRGVEINSLVQEFSRLDVSPGTYDVVWLSRMMYSCIPTQARRIEMVKRISRALKPGGFFLCQFRWHPGVKTTVKGIHLRRLFAFCTMGNREYEAGDILWFNKEFIHEFSSESAIEAEMEAGGLHMVRFQGSEYYRGWALCKKEHGG